MTMTLPFPKISLVSILIPTICSFFHYQKNIYRLYFRVSSAIAAKRNRYHRQKSLMLLEMETQNTNGFQSPMNPL